MSIYTKKEKTKFSSYRKGPTCIVIHSTNCPHLSYDSKFVKDSSDYDFWKVFKDNAFPVKSEDVNVHYFVEMALNDPQIIVGKPLHYVCDYNLHDKFRKAIHIMILGDFNEHAINKEIYEVIGHKIILPMIKLFNISKNNIFMHSEISKDSDKCPGIYFSKKMLIKSIR